MPVLSVISMSLIHEAEKRITFDLISAYILRL